MFYEYLYILIYMSTVVEYNGLKFKREQLQEKWDEFHE